MGGYRRARAHLGISILLLGCVCGCGSNEYAPPPPPAVTAERPVVRDVTRFVDYTGTTRAVESVEVRARVKGYLQSMHFQPGDFVEKGDLLFVIDPEPFEVALEAANSELAISQAQFDLSQTRFERSRQMYERKATNELQFLQARAERDKAAAAVAASESAVHAAQLDYDYAHVKAPIAGRVGRHLVDLGNLVGAGDATRLTEMVRYSPIYVYFHVSERDLLALQADGRKRRRERGTDFEDRERARVYVALADEEDYPHEGKIDFTALQIDPDTGTLEVRGILQNEGELDEIIAPGAFVRVRVPIGEQQDALLVSERALGADQSGRFLLVVNDEDVVEQRQVEVGSRIDDLRVIEKGLRAEDWVIVNGLQRARPGARVAATRAGGGDGNAEEGGEADSAAGSASAPGGE